MLGISVVEHVSNRRVGGPNASKAASNLLRYWKVYAVGKSGFPHGTLPTLSAELVQKICSHRSRTLYLLDL